ncbi:meteorin-like protein [Synchiropus picturatus]
MIVFMLVAVFRFCAGDPCNWTGSGLNPGEDPRIILQVRLRCSQGSVRWLHPGHAIRVVLEPNLSSSRHTTVCIKPSPSLRGASVFVERFGKLHPLATDEGKPQQVTCYHEYGPELPAIYIQTGPQRERPWSRQRLGFKYELLGNRSSDLQHLQTSCQPCDDVRLLSAICSSDFVVRGHIQGVTHHAGRQASQVEVSAVRVYWQRGGVFEARGPHWHGRIHTHLQCQVKPGGGVFLFMGSEHFGEAWLGCAPRFKDFLLLYRRAKAAQENSCDFPLD